MMGDVSAILMLLASLFRRGGDGTKEQWMPVTRQPLGAKKCCIVGRLKTSHAASFRMSCKGWMTHAGTLSRSRFQRSSWEMTRAWTRTCTERTNTCFIEWIYRSGLLLYRIESHSELILSNRMAEVKYSALHSTLIGSSETTLVYYKFLSSQKGLLNFLLNLHYINDEYNVSMALKSESTHFSSGRDTNRMKRNDAFVCACVCLLLLCMFRCHACSQSVSNPSETEINWTELTINWAPVLSQPP